MNEETLDEAQQRIYDFVDRYQTHVNRAQITAKRLLNAQIELMIFVTYHISVMPDGFENAFNKYSLADSEYKESIAQLLEDWRYLVSNDV